MSGRVLFDDLRPLLGRRAAALEHAWLTGDRAGRHEIEVVAELLRRRATTDRSVLLHPPSGDEADGPLRLGRIVHGRSELAWLGLTERELTQHMAVTGRSGSGKSTLCLRLLLGLLERGVPWLVFDYKRSARALRGVDAGRSVHVTALGRDIGASTGFNILVPPPGLTPDVHQRQLVELIAESWYAGDGVIALLERAMSRAYEAWSPRWPTILDVRSELEAMPSKGRELMWKSSAQRILQQLTTGQLGRILTARRDAAALERLRHGHTVVELDGLAVNDAAFLTQHIVRDLTCRLLAEGDREKLRFVCLVEEAHHLLAKREGSHETALETALREGREVGLGILLADQCISAISPTALANCYTTVCLNTRQRADVVAGAGSLLLGEEQRALLSLLPVGEAVVRLSDRWPHPVHLRIPALPLPKGTVTDADVRLAHLQGPYSAAALDVAVEESDSVGVTHESEASSDRPAVDRESGGRGATASGGSGASGVVGVGSDSGGSGDSRVNRAPSVRSAAVPDRPPPDKADEKGNSAGEAARMHAVRTHSRGAQTLHADSPDHPPHESREKQISSETGEDGGVRDAEDDEQDGAGVLATSEGRLLLESVAHQPLAALTARFDALGLSRRKGTAAKAALIDEDYLRQVDLPTPSGRTVLLALTEAGRSWLLRRRVVITPVHGSLPHAWWQQRVADMLREAGWQVQTEARIDGHAVDVVAERGGRRVLVEVETGRSDWLANLARLEVIRAEAKAVLWLDPETRPRAAAAVPAGVRLLTPVEVGRWVDGCRP